MSLKRFPAKALTKLLASYYDQTQPSGGRRAARTAAAVAQGPFTSGLTKLRTASNQTTQIQHLHRYQPGDYRKAAYPLADGGGLLLLTLSGSREVFPRDRRAVPALRQGGSRSGFGGLVPPGVYHAVTFQTATILAVEVPPRGSGGKLRVVAFRDQPLSATTSAASA